MVEKVTDSFLNWGFNPSVSTQGFNNPPYVGALVKFWYRNTEEGAEFTIYYIFNFRAITNTKLFNKCKKLLESVEEGKQQQKWNKANYLITRLVALAIANEWGYDDFDDIEGPLVNDERYTTLRFDIYENEFNWRGIHPINTPFFDFLRYDVQMFDISEGMEIALNYAEMIPGWAELDEGA